MGNSSSSPSPAREQNRLSKPRTNTNAPPLSSQSTTSLKAGSSAPRSWASRNSEWGGSECSVVNSTNGDSRSRRETRQLLRSHLIDPINEDSAEVESRTPTKGANDSGGMSSRSGSGRRSLSRTGSATSRNTSLRGSSSTVNRSRLSLAPDPQTVEVDSAPAILHGLKEDSSQEQADASCNALLSDREPTHGAGGDPLSMESVKVIRRRSLAVTPGLATRGDSPNVLRKPAQQLATRRQTWHRPVLDMPGTDPLARLRPRSSGNDGGRPSSRAVTPADIEYPHLGALKPGSLVVTNGAASPEPRMLAAAGVDYFTVKQAQYPMKILRQSNRATGSRFVLKANGRSADRVDHIPGNDTTLPHKPPGSTASRLGKVPQPERLDSAGAGQGLLNGPSEPDPRRASWIAKEYISELSSHPAQKSLPDEEIAGSAQTKKARMDSGVDEGYDSSPGDESAIFREEALRMLEGSAFDINKPVPGLESPETPPSTTENSTVEKSTRPSKTTTDSGYSSEASLRRLGAMQPAGELEFREPTRPSHNRSASTGPADKKFPASSSSELHVPKSDAMRRIEPEKDRTLVKSKSSRFLRFRSKSWKSSEALDSKKTPARDEKPPKPGVVEVDPAASTPKRLQKPRPLSVRSSVAGSSSHGIPYASIPTVPTRKSEDPSRASVASLVDSADKGYASADEGKRYGVSQKRKAEFINGLRQNPVTISDIPNPTSPPVHLDQQAPLTIHKNDLQKVKEPASGSRASKGYGQQDGSDVSSKSDMRRNSQPGLRRSYENSAVRAPHKQGSQEHPGSQDSANIRLARPKSMVSMPSMEQPKASNAENGGKQSRRRKSFSQDSLSSEREQDRQTKVRAHRRTMDNEAPPVPPLPPGAKSPPISAPPLQRRAGNPQLRQIDTPKRSLEAGAKAVARSSAPLARYYASPAPPVQSVRQSRSLRPLKQTGPVAAA